MNKGGTTECMQDTYRLVSSVVVGLEKLPTDRQHQRERSTSAPGKCWVMNEVLLGKSIVPEGAAVGVVTVPRLPPPRPPQGARHADVEARLDGSSSRPVAPIEPLMDLGGGGAAPPGPLQPVFDEAAPRSVSSLTGGTAYLHCVVHHLGGGSVSTCVLPVYLCGCTLSLLCTTVPPTRSVMHHLGGGSVSTRVLPVCLCGWVLSLISALYIQHTQQQHSGSVGTHMPVDLNQRTFVCVLVVWHGVFVFRCVQEQCCALVKDTVPLYLVLECLKAGALMALSPVSPSAWTVCRFTACTPTLLALPPVSWIRRRDLHILTVGTYTYTTDQRFEVVHAAASRDWILKLRYAQERDSGLYDCQVSRRPVLTYSVRLSVYAPRASIVGAPDMHVDRGSTINLTCTVSHTPEPPAYIFWYHNGQVNVPFFLSSHRAGNESQVVNYESPRGGVTVVTERGNVTRGFLLIQDARPSDSGNYTCAPSNTAPSWLRVHVLNGETPAAMQTNGGGRVAETSLGFPRASIPLLATINLILTATLTGEGPGGLSRGMAAPLPPQGAFTVHTGAQTSTCSNTLPNKLTKPPNRCLHTAANMDYTCRKQTFQHLWTRPNSASPRPRHVSSSGAELLIPWGTIHYSG
ncbi:hypothetical protein O3P69_010728 [Scylla paramamosain]|uniref:Ig-like domain-containing protein n=1 Tax=Scylla paramamosain TaxID=85552 RepID=A0AAW0TFV5_SCYPA